MYRKILILVLCVLALSTFCQNPVMDTRAIDRDISGSTRNALGMTSSLANYPLDNIGPTIMSGRVTDVAVNPEDPTEFYISYASGGLWYTNNNGTTFKPKFDNESVMTIGAIAVEWSSKTIYVGTGEVNSSRSSYAGNGVYKSTDGGDSWTNIGLHESHHIGQVIIDKSNSNRILVAALGHLYSPNVERGFYLSEDGGRTWQQTLFINENSGGVDMIQDPKQPNTIYAAIWERERRAWDFKESGEGSGIYKSTDGGKKWKLISSKESGFPIGSGVGRIGLDVTYKNDKAYVYAILDNYDRRPKEDEDKKEELTKEDFKEISVSDFLALEDDDLGTFLESNNFPNKYTPEKIKSLVKLKTIEPKSLAEYLEDANSMLFDTDVIGAEVYLSEDNGISFKKTHKGYINGLYNSYGYYFGKIIVEPNNPSVSYILGVPILRSDDFGASWKSISGDNVHADHHELWVNPMNPKHIINGNDGGVNISYDKGENWIKCNTPSVGQFYAVNVDNASPYNVYAGAQDNGVWVGPSDYKHNVRWHQSGKYPYQSLIGGDGMQIQIDNRDHNVVYTGFQFGNYFRINQSTGDRSYITPKHELGDRPYRWNWQAPILLSTHNQDILYMGCNKLMRSLDKGENFKEISRDLTKGGKKGDVAYGTIVTIDESIENFGKLVIGTDDGKVQLTKDGGITWQDISLGLPLDRWVSRAIFSQKDDNIIYVSINGYRWDDFSSYLYKSTDNGQSWEAISSSLPVEPINVIKEDPADSDILYVGTDHGLYISLNGGASFETLADSMPNVAVHDVVVQAKEDHLIVGTHGRSIYKVDLQYIRKLKNNTEEIYLFDLPKTKYKERWGYQYAVYSDVYEPSLYYEVYSNKNTKGAIIISTIDKKELFKESITISKGINKLEYHLNIDTSNEKVLEKYINKDKKKGEKLILKKGENGKIYLMPGEYILDLKVDGKNYSKQFNVVSK